MVLTIPKKHLHILSQVSTLEKGVNMYQLDRAFTFEKTGKEIKEKLAIELEKCCDTEKKILMQLPLLIQQIGREPDLDHSGYRDIEGKALALKRYSYQSDGELQSGEVGDKYNSYVEQYNDSVYCYFDCIRKKCQMETLMNNLEDNKKYPLSLELISALGF